MSKLTQNEIADLLKRPAPVSLPGIDLSGTDLSGADLGGADMRVVGLSKANLSRADLRNAELRSADLRAHLSDIQQPTLVIHGERDTLAPIAAAEFTASRDEAAG